MILVTIVAEAVTGRETVTAIRTYAPDIVFLDIKMPELDGFDVLRETPPAAMPAVVIVTAFDQYAVRAFDTGAVDYLLKPFDAERLDRAIDRAVSRARSSVVSAAGIFAFLERLVRHGERRTRVPLSIDGVVRFVDAAAIDWIEADDKEVIVHTAKGSLRAQQALSAIVDQLDPATFVRVHRSSVINVAAIIEVQRWFHGDFVLLLRNGARVRTGRSYRDAVKRFAFPGG